MANPVEFFGGAVLGTTFSALYAGVEDLIAKNYMFKSLFKDIQSMLDTLKPLIADMAHSNQQLSYTNKDELNGVEAVLKNGEKLVLKCSKVSRWDLFTKYKFARKLLAWQEEFKRELKMLRMQGMKVDMKMAVLIEGIKVSVGSVKEGVDQISGTLKEASQISKANFGVEDHFAEHKAAWCAVPELPQLVVGMEAPLKELKMKLLQDDGVSMFVVTAPGGCGKTTLATKFCQDEHVKGKFKDNIFFVTVSKNPSLNHIVEQLYRHKGSEVPTFHNEVNAVNWLQTFLRNEGKKPLLLVLDDVWSGSESLLDKFQIAIPDYRILVTSRSDFPAFSAPFHLPLLVQDDAVKLFHHSASLEDKSSYIPKHLSQKIIERCKGFPLAIKVVGRSLCAQPIEMWQKRVIEWSKGSSILDSETDLLLCLQSSLDALDKQKTIIKECFLDLGSFPEDKRIPVTALIDMWAELYDLDEEALCLANLYELSNWSLANVVDNSRFMKMDGEGYYGKYYVTQHDLLRELAIYHSKLDSVEHQKRLFIDISGGIFPKWWREQKYQSIHARLLSITAECCQRNGQRCNSQMQKFLS